MYTITYGKTFKTAQTEIHIEYSQQVNENRRPEDVYKQLKEFVDTKFRELQKTFDI